MGAFNGTVRETVPLPPVIISFHRHVGGRLFFCSSPAVVRTDLTAIFPPSFFLSVLLFPPPLNDLRERFFITCHVVYFSGCVGAPLFVSQPKLRLFLVSSVDYIRNMACLFSPRLIAFFTSTLVALPPSEFGHPLASMSGWCS